MLAGNEVGLDEHDVSFALMIHVVAIDEVLDIKLNTLVNILFGYQLFHILVI